MKIKKSVALMIVVFLLASCAPAVEVVPTEMAIPTIAPTITFTPLPTETSTPDYIPTPTEKAGAELLTFIETDGIDGWKIDNAQFNDTKFTSFGSAFEGEGGYPTFGAKGVGETSIRCIVEITLPSKETVSTGIFYWHNLKQINPITWEGIKYMLGVGVGGGSEPGKVYCENSIKGRMESGLYTDSALVHKRIDKEGRDRVILVYA